MFSLGMVSTNLFMLFYVGGYRIQLEMARYFFLQVGEICKSRHVEVRFYPHYCR